MENSDREKKYIVRVGKRTDVDLREVLADVESVDLNEIKKVLEQDGVEARLRLIREFRMIPFAGADDITEWDREVLLATWPPMYSRGADDQETSSARFSLQTACRGCATQMATARRVLDYIARVFGSNRAVSHGKFMDMADFTWIGVMCGFYPTTVKHLQRAMDYAEEQIKKAQAVADAGTASVAEMESHAMHAGSVLFIAQEVLEVIKVSIYGMTTAGNLSLADVAWYPLPMWTGRGMMEANKKALVFIGDDFIPMCLVVDKLKEKKATENYEVCGIGQAADDLPRIYDRARHVGPMGRAAKILRTGIFDVIAGSDACLDVDLVGIAKKAGAKLIWTGNKGLEGVRDRTGEGVEGIVKDALAGEAVWVRDEDKAAEVVMKVLEGAGERSGDNLMDDAEAKAEAQKCRDNCDLCFYACPSGVLVSRGVKAVKKEGLKALTDLEKKCCLHGKCGEACPENIRIPDMMVSTHAQTAADDKFLFRAGRAFATNNEIRAYGYTAFPGNCPGWFSILGCGGANPEDVQWMANELASRNAIVGMSGCAVGDYAHLYDPEERKWSMQRYPFWTQPRSVANYGGCSTCHALPMITLKYSRGGTGVTTVANYVENVDIAQPIFVVGTIVWGDMSDRMIAMVRAMIRSGQP
ncbi:MAG: hypothetical protein QF579_05275, partial [Dehalococcoidia bacterium]|nr:hypothetical protein [Dehalococcoidia bacterium]